MCSSESWRDREQELLALEVAGARIHSSVERNLEGNLILVGLDLVRITCYCRRNPQRPRRSRVIPWAAPTSPFFTEILTSAGNTWFKLQGNVAGMCWSSVTCSASQPGQVLVEE